MSAITITLQKIRDNSPCRSGWAQVLRAHEHLGMDVEFPLASVLDSNTDVLDTVWCMQCLPEYENLWRKFAVWCAAQVEQLLTDERSRNAIRVAWKHSCGLATDEELAAAEAAARAAAWDAAEAAARAAAEAAAWGAARDAARSAAWDAAWDAARAAQRKKLTEILMAGTWVDVEFARLMEGNNG